MTKLSKILRIVAAAAFLTALAVNVKVTLTDPFVGMSEEAIAQTTSETGSTGGTGTTQFFNVKETRLRSISVVQSWSAGAKIDGSIPFVGELVDKAIATIEGTIHWASPSAIDQYEILCPATTIAQTVQCIPQGWTTCATTGCPEAGIENR